MHPNGAGWGSGAPSYLGYWGVGVTTTRDGYELGAVIGRGVTGVVRRGIEERSGTAVAVKLVRSDLARDRRWVARLVDERAALDQVDHPGIVAIRDLVIDSGTVTIVTEMVDGTNLRRLLERESAIEVWVAARIIGELLSALAAAHAAGVVHGGLKPENVLIGAKQNVRVTDFGIASLRERELIAPARDVYSAGALLHELITGTSPGFDAHGVLKQRAELPDQLWELMTEMLALDPEARPNAADSRLRLAALMPRLNMLQTSQRSARAPKADPAGPTVVPPAESEAAPTPVAVSDAPDA